MKNEGWHETKKDFDIDPDGKLIPKKITLEKRERQILGLSFKDFLDTIIKTISLLSVFAAIIALIINYKALLNQQDSKSREIKRIALLDSLDRVRSEFELVNKRRSDSLERRNTLKKDSIDYTNRKFQDSIFRVQQANFYMGIANSFKQINLQKKYDIEKERSLFQLKVYSEICTEINRCINLINSGKEYHDALNNLKDELYPKLQLINEPIVIKQLDLIIKYIDILSDETDLYLNYSQLDFECLMFNSKVNEQFDEDSLKMMKSFRSDSTFYLNVQHSIDSVSINFDAGYWQNIRLLNIDNCSCLDSLQMYNERFFENSKKLINSYRQCNWMMYTKINPKSSTYLHPSFNELWNEIENLEKLRLIGKSSNNFMVNLINTENHVQDLKLELLELMINSNSVINSKE